MSFNPLALVVEGRWCTVWCWQNWTFTKGVNQEHSK